MRGLALATYIHTYVHTCTYIQIHSIIHMYVRMYVCMHQGCAGTLGLGIADVPLHACLQIYPAAQLCAARLILWKLV